MPNYQWPKRPSSEQNRTAPCGGRPHNFIRTQDWSFCESSVTLIWGQTVFIYCTSSMFYFFQVSFPLFVIFIRNISRFHFSFLICVSMHCHVCASNCKCERTCCSWVPSRWRSVCDGRGLCACAAPCPRCGTWAAPAHAPDPCTDWASRRRPGPSALAANARGCPSLRWNRNTVRQKQLYLHMYRTKYWWERDSFS